MFSARQEAASDSNNNNNGLGDVEKHGATPQSLPLPDLKRKLKSRHLQMIAIGTLASFVSLLTTSSDSPRWYYWNWSLHR